eukprot:gene12939-17230_t
MQILSILNAFSAKVPSLSFMYGREHQLQSELWNCGIVITMNPGYLCRPNELPDNLKALIMRPVAMMTPDDLTMVIEVMLASEEFNEARVMAIARKLIQQLSEQDHYDYYHGLRNLKAVLNMAGQRKRNDPTMAEEE